LASCLAMIQETSPELATVMAAWHMLPKAVKAGILAMVRTVRE